MTPPEPGSFDDLYGAPLDPVTFAPYPEGMEPVSLSLTYDSEGEGFDYAGLRTRLPLWLAVVAGAYVLANYAGERI